MPSGNVTRWSGSIDNTGSNSNASDSPRAVARHEPSDDDEHALRERRLHEQIARALPAREGANCQTEHRGAEQEFCDAERELPLFRGIEHHRVTLVRPARFFSIVRRRKQIDLVIHRVGRLAIFGDRLTAAEPSAHAEEHRDRERDDQVPRSLLSLRGRDRRAHGRVSRARSTRAAWWWVA